MTYIPIILAKLEWKWTDRKKKCYNQRSQEGNNPLLFSIVIDKIVSFVKHLEEYQMGNEINMLCYTDYIALVVYTEDELQRLL